MKTYALVVLISFFCFYSFTEIRGLPGKKIGRDPKSINRSINEFFHDLSIHDPLVISHDNVSHWDHNLEVSNATLSGFSNVYASTIRTPKFLNRKVLVVLNANRLDVTIGHYILTGNSTFGNGSARISIENVKIEFHGKYHLFKDELTVEHVITSIGHGEVSITGLYNDEDRSKNISQRMENFLNQEFNTNEKIQENISNYLKERLNRRH